MNLDDFSYTENDRRYINPQVSLDEQNAFIDNLRNTQQANTAQITQDTQNLGSELPSNLGGLGGGTSYFKARYQTPQTNSMVADLRATAQAQALGTLMSNEIAKAKKRYNDAYRAAKKRSGGGGGGGNTNGNNLDKLTVDQTNDNNAGDKQTVKNYTVLNEAGEKVTVTADQLAELKRGAETNLRVWQRRREKLGNNTLDRLFNGKSYDNADKQLKYWQDTLNRLNNWEVTEE